MVRKVCVITGSRAEYGLLRCVMEDIKMNPNLILQLIVTGTHLSLEHGLTYKEIELDGFYIDSKVDIIESDDQPVGISNSMAHGIIGCAAAYEDLKPDLILVLGDRFEIFAATAAALVAGIPVAHLHGGELTLGAFDESLRHAITKMSHFHFVAAEEYRNRVIQMGEDPRNVHMVGGLGLDSIKNLKLLKREELEESLKLKFNSKSLLITFHPVTLEPYNSAIHMKELLASLSELTETTLIFTMPNADTGGRELMQLVEEFVAQEPNAHVFKSLGQLKYFSTIAQVDGVVGNSSSGIAEVPSFRKGTVNIGDRQEGRLKASSVIDCDPTFYSIRSAIQKLYSDDFQRALSKTKNPYGQFGASSKIVDIIQDVPLANVIKKHFHDIAK